MRASRKNESFRWMAHATVLLAFLTAALAFIHELLAFL